MTEGGVSVKECYMNVPRGSIDRACQIVTKMMDQAYDSVQLFDIRAINYTNLYSHDYGSGNRTWTRVRKNTHHRLDYDCHGRFRYLY